MIKDGRIDTFNIDYPQALWTMKNTNIELKRAGELKNDLNVYIAFCRNSRGKELRKIYDNGFRKFYRNDEVRRIYQEYNLESEWKKIDKSYFLD